MGIDSDHLTDSTSPADGRAIVSDRVTVAAEITVLRGWLDRIVEEAMRAKERSDAELDAVLREAARMGERLALMEEQAAKEGD